MRQEPTLIAKAASCRSYCQTDLAKLNDYRLRVVRAKALKYALLPDDISELGVDEVWRQK